MRSSISIFTVPKPIDFSRKVKVSLLSACVCACKVEFVGVRGASELSDIAIDNLQITADACPGGNTQCCNKHRYVLNTF